MLWRRNCSSLSILFREFSLPRSKGRISGEKCTSINSMRGYRNQYSLQTPTKQQTVARMAWPIVEFEHVRATIQSSFHVIVATSTRERLEQSHGRLSFFLAAAKEMSCRLSIKCIYRRAICHVAYDWRCFASPADDVQLRHSTRWPQPLASSTRTIWLCSCYHYLMAACL
jgi:hypothetical protein